MTEPKAKKPSKMELWRAEYNRQQEHRKKVLDDRYYDVEEYHESQVERELRIMETPAAWQSMTR